jgi:hypothetical protein
MEGAHTFPQKCTEQELSTEVRAVEDHAAVSRAWQDPGQLAWRAGRCRQKRRQGRRPEERNSVSEAV